MSLYFEAVGILDKGKQAREYNATLCNLAPDCSQIKAASRVVDKWRCYQVELWQ